MLQLPASPMKIGEVWAKAFELWRISFSRVQLIALFFAFWMFVPFFLILELNTHELSEFIWVNVEVKAAVIIFIILLCNLAYAVVYRMLHLIMQGFPIVYAEVFQFALKKWPVLLIAFLLSFLSVFAGLLLLLLPAFYVAFVLMLYPMLIVIDNLMPLHAWRRCFQLVNNNWWRNFITLGVPTLIFLIITVTVEHYTVGIGPHALNHPAHYDSWLVFQLVRMLLSGFYFPIFGAILLVQIQNLKIREQLKVAEKPTSQVEVLA